MSGVISAIGKTFKAVVIRPLTHPFDIGGNISGAFHAIKHELVTGWHNPIIRMAAIAVAAYFTAGAAMAYFGPAAAAGGGAAAGVGAGAGAEATVGIMAGSTTASTAAAGFGGLATFGAADTAAVGYGALAADAATVGAGATLTGAAAGSAAAGGSLAAFSGQAVGAQALAAGAPASTISQATGLASMPAGASDAALGQVSTAAGNPVNFDFTAASGGSYGTAGATPGAGSALTDTSGLTQFGGAPSTLGAGTGGTSSGSGFSLANTAPAGSDLSATTPTSFMGRVENGASNLWQDVKSGVSKMFGGSAAPGTSGAAGTSGTTAAAAPAGGSLLGDMGKAMLVQGGLQMASALLQKPQAQMQYAGVNAKGQGAGLGIHTINSGFGLATGGSEPAPSGVPDNLKPGAGSLTAGAYTGAQLSNAAVAGGNGGAQPGNLGQTVANSAGIGGLVPQGAVDYMRSPA